MIGTTRSRVNVFMNKFRRLRYIHYDGNVIVVRGPRCATPYSTMTALANPTTAWQWPVSA